MDKFVFDKSLSITKNDMNSHCCHRANEVGVWATKNQNNSSVISLLVMQEGQSQVPLN